MKLRIEIDAKQAMEFASMLKAMEDEKAPAHPVFQAMIMTLYDKIYKAAMDQLTLEQINEITQ
jgi:hypothetical protein